METATPATCWTPASAWVPSTVMASDHVQPPAAEFQPVVSSRVKRVVAVMGTAIWLEVMGTAAGGSVGSLFVNGAETPVPTWLPVASSSTKLQTI